MCLNEELDNESLSLQRRSRPQHLHYSRSCRSFSVLFFFSRPSFFSSLCQCAPASLPTCLPQSCVGCSYRSPARCNLSALWHLTGIQSPELSVNS